MQATPCRQILVLFFGVLVGFIAAVAAGHWAKNLHEPDHFERFHRQISPDAAFYPPFSMMENLALEHWAPGKTVVLIGGNSVLNGVSQPLDVLWSRGLQELLGPRFTVVNLAFRSAYAAEGAALVAESLLQRGVPVIYVADALPGAVPRAYDGTYPYFFWQALAQGRLLPNPARADDLLQREHTSAFTQTEEMHAAKLGGDLNALLRFQELWHHVAYRDFFTVWSALGGKNFLRPKEWWPDDEDPPSPMTDRFQGLPASALARELEAIVKDDHEQSEPDGAGGWRPSAKTRLQVGQDLDEIFVPPLKARMLVLLIRHSRYHRDRLAPADQALDAALFSTYQKLWQEHGINCLVTGSDFEEADYSDIIHLSGLGGRKLALVVAEQVRAMTP